MYDALVIGGGPIGSHIAYRLGKSGYHVAVIEKKSDFDGPVCCTGIVSEECIREFSIGPEVIFRHARSAVIFSPSKNILRFERSEPQAAVLDRPAFNKMMAVRARDQGAEYIMNTRVTDIEVSASTVTLSIERRKYKNTISGAVVIITTGADISLLRKINLWKSGDIVTGAQAEVIAPNVNEVEVYVGKHIAPGFFGWLVPTTNGKALAGLLSRRYPKRYLERFLETLEEQGKIASKSVSVNRGNILISPLSRTYANRLIVVGTAAGQVKPTTGGGIYFGLISANVAADVLLRAFEIGDFSSSILCHYERDWKKVLAKELKMGSRARLLFEHLSDSHLDQAFDIMGKNKIIERLMEQENLSFDWHSHTVRHLLQEMTLDKLIKGMKSLLPGRNGQQWRPRRKVKID